MRAIMKPPDAARSLALSASVRLMMEYFGYRHAENPLAGGASAVTPVGIVPIDKKALVEKAHLG
jgi:hypothetical protein